MTHAQKIHVESRLSKLAFDGGGITASAAMTRANIVLQDARLPCLVALDEGLKDIERRFGNKAANRSDEPLQDLYDLSMKLIDASIGAPGTDIDQAARALCELVQLSISQGRVNWIAIDVHLQALQLLRSRGTSLAKANTQSILDGLSDITAKQQAPA